MEKYIVEITEEERRMIVQYCSPTSSWIVQRMINSLKEEYFRYPEKKWIKESIDLYEAKVLARAEKNEIKRKLIDKLIHL